MKIIRIIFLFGMFFLPLHAIAADNGWGFNFTYPLKTADPPKLQGYRLAISYQPATFIWGHSRLYFDASFGHWGLQHVSDNHQVNIIAVAPYFRYYFHENKYISPYGEISIGPSYLSRTRLDDHNLGMHFAFQDQVAFGASMGEGKKVSISLGALHYSNGSLCENNRGMSIPLYIKVGYRF
jgi:hypothetical protein